MAGSVNKVILIGNLGKDPEIRRTQDGRPIANLSIATSETWRDKDTGERKEKTEWHRVVIFSEAALQDRRAVSEEGRQGLHRGRAADPQMDRPERRREILDRGRAAGLQLDADHARRPQRRSGGGGGNFGSDDSGGDFGSGGPSSSAPRRAVAAAAAAATATWTTKFRSEASGWCGQRSGAPADEPCAAAGGLRDDPAARLRGHGGVLCSASCSSRHPRERCRTGPSAGSGWC